MSYLDRVNACNDLDLTGMRPFRADGIDLGWVSQDHAAVLAQHGDVFTVTAEDVTFAPKLRAPAERSAAAAAIASDLAATGFYGTLRNEIYAVKRAWSDTAAFNIDRGLVAGFGFRAYGVHVNGFVRREDGFDLWIGTRAVDRDVEPGKLDNMVAGGQPAHLSLMENVIKECGEEAGLPPDIARTARPVGELSYALSRAHSLKIDTLFCYDLEMPPDVTPENTDGEISGFALMPMADVLALISDTTRFKFNVNLVILDFAIRHGVLDPDREPDFERIVTGLHRRTSGRC